MPPRLRTCASALAILALVTALTTSTPTQAQSPATQPAPCKQCAEWNIPQDPIHIYGNTYYVGVHGLASILITSPQGHVLIDGDLAESAAQIAAHVRSLGFRLEDVKLILNTHVHYDHAGGIAELQRLSGAEVAASEPAALVLKSGHSGPDDPQYGVLPPIDKVSRLKVIKDGETLHVGPLAVTAHFTPGHTPGGTSWTWQSCEAARCLNIVYADSLSAISADNFRFSSTRTYPKVQQDFAKSFATLSSLPCDILLTPHPDMSGLWERLAKRDQGGDANALVDTTACKRYADTARANYEKRLEQEAGSASR
jgi:metallo-beta-lactamase class B